MCARARARGACARVSMYVYVCARACACERGREGGICAHRPGVEARAHDLILQKWLHTLVAQLRVHLPTPTPTPTPMGETNGVRVGDISERMV